MEQDCGSFPVQNQMQGLRDGKSSLIRMAAMHELVAALLAVKNQAKLIEVAHMLQRHLPSLLTYFRHRITNAVSEGLNSKIQAIKHHAYGFRSWDHFEIAIWFHCGGLELFPFTHRISG